jgi:hypothetical protein
MAATQNCTPAVESQVREIVSLLSKTAKNYQVYLPNNRIFQSSLAELRHAFEIYLDEYEVLTLAVKEFEMLYDTVPVYSNQDRYQSIAFRMYRDGVRLVSFHRGISEEDLVAFFEALTRCLDRENLEEDFVTLLWEKDLQSITYYEVSDYDTSYEKCRPGAAEGMDPEFRLPSATMAEAQWTDVTREVERIMPALDLTPGDLDEVKNLAFVVEDDRFLRRAWQVLSSTFEASDPRETCLDLENGVTGFLDLCVDHRQLGSAAEVLSDLKGRYGAVPGSDVRSALSRIVESRHSDANMEVVGTCLASDRETDQDQCLAYLSQLSPAALPSVMKLLPKCSHQSARQILVMSMASIGKEDPAGIAKCTEGESEDEVDAILDALAAVGSESALVCAMEFREQSSPKIRAKVASLASRARNDVAIKVTQALIQDQHPTVRRKALASLVEIGGERCMETLVRLFTSREFNLLPRDRKTSMLLATRRLPPEGQKQVLETVFKMRGWRHRRSMDDTKAALVDILHLMPSEVVDYFEDNLAQCAPRSLEKAIDAALRKVRRDEPTR